MNVTEARKMVEQFDENRMPTEEDIFIFTEAMNYLIREEKKPEDMMYLGGYYYEQKRFDLALKYYEMAESFDYEPAYECLGYIWYYGRTGERDFKKAFYYFSKMMEKGNLVATYKVADMYRNGYHVEQDYEKYVEIMEKLYTEVCKCNNVFDPIPEVFTRLARIRTKENRITEAVSFYLDAKDCLAKRIKFNAFFGNLNMMKWLIDDLYELIEFDEEYFDFYDMLYSLKTPHKIRFCLDDQTYLIEAVKEDGDECHIRFDGKWYYNRDDFYKKACINNVKLTNLYDQLYGFEVI